MRQPKRADRPAERPKVPAPRPVATLSPSEEPEQSFNLKLSGWARAKVSLKTYAVEGGLAVALLAVGVAVGYQLHTLPGGVAKAPVTQPKSTSVADKKAPIVPVVEPEAGLRIKIASIGVNAPIVPVGETRDGNMDVPNSTGTVGLYQNGAKPGEVGNAVMAGHEGFPGQKSVFTNLHLLKAGDTVTISQDGAPMQFRVIKTAVMTPAEAPLQEIFGPTTGTHLNLITCAGTWDGHSYDKRLVVYTERM